MSGAPGSGKTTLARRLAPMLGLALISKDTIKESLWDSLAPPPGDREWSRRLGAAAMALIWRLAEQAPAAMLEANFRPHSPTERSRLLALGGSVVEVHCWCPPTVAAERYAHRALDPSHHPAHVSPTLDDTLLGEFDQPIGIGTVDAGTDGARVPMPVWAVLMKSPNHIDEAATLLASTAEVVGIGSDPWAS